MSKARRRLDQELVEQGLFATRDEAMRAVMAGLVSTTDHKMTSPGEQVLPGIALHVRGQQAYVSRGGTKLEHGLRELGVSAEGCACLDVGCSTGGFTDCLLRHGATSVVAVDVGRAQFDWSLRQDSRVTLFERTNMVDLPQLSPEHVGAIDLAVCDVSFTSVATVLPAVCAMLAPGATFLTLVKPQFEAAREDVGEGGIVRDPEVRAAALAKIRDAFEREGFTHLRSCESPIRGHKGNVEYLLAGQLGED